MIIWLASFPRSGNTLTRTILKQVFGVESYSVYDDAHDLGADQRVAETVGHVRHGKTWAEMRPRLRDDDRLHFVKTHEPPEDGGRAIYVVREPVSCFVSFRHYLREYFQRGFRPEEFAAGLTPWGSWSSHIENWHPERRENTLLLRYEDLVTDAEPQIEKIAAFTGLPVRSRWTNTFDQLRKAEPRFFRRGRVSTDETEVPADDALLIRFWSQHWLRRLSYDVAPEVSSPENAAEALRRVGAYVGLRLRELHDRERDLSVRLSYLEPQQPLMERRESSARSWREVGESEADLHQRVQMLEYRLNSLAKTSGEVSRRLEDLSGVKTSFWHMVANIDRRTRERLTKRRAA